MAKKKKTGYESRKTTPSNKKVIVTTSNTEKRRVEPTVSRTSRGTVGSAPVKMLYGKQHFMLMGLGIFLVILGMFLMSGGAQDPNEWNTDEIYSFRRITLAPIIILTGLGVELYAIFKK